MVFLKSLNPKLNPRYAPLASHYMRYGEALGVRWDYAFFQMLLETGHLTYKGDVRADQNNFAGLGATGRGVRGERFPDIATGVRAHLEHIVMYSGEKVKNPVAERTRNIQEWDVLTDWQRGFSRPITYTDLAEKWAPGSNRYTRNIQSIAERFFEGPCLEPDPQPELVAQIRGKADKQAETPVAQRSKTAPETTARLPSSGTGASATGTGVSPLTAGLSVGAAAMAEAGSKANEKAAPKADTAAKASTSSGAKAPVQTASMSPSVRILNSAPSDEASSSAKATPAASSSSAKPAAGVEVAALAGSGAAQADAVEKATKKKKKPSASKKNDCRVWTASYGGTKAIIIKAKQDATTNYTVLDVNEGAEKREAEAYINAYAKGGQQVGEFSTQTQALEKAFELCPEG